jgi:membrane-associated phospholipid phosphatase
MRRYLLVALWPAGMAAITAATVVALRRGRAPAGLPDPGASTGHGGPKPVGEAGPDAPPSVRTAEGNPGQDGPDRALPGWLPGLAGLGVASAAGGVLSYELMVLLGRPIVRHGPRVDVPIMEWTGRNQVEPWAAVLERLNKVPNTWTTWGACGAAAACLAASRPAAKWLPPSVLGAAIVVDHYVTLALRHKFRRPGPPTSPLGTYPSGGCDRVVLFYGLIANLVWREYSGSQRGKAMALGATSLLAFNAAYCRQYLSKHWFTDVITGLLYGALLYVPFAVAVRLLDGPPARRAARPAQPDGAPVRAASLAGAAAVTGLLAEPPGAGPTGPFSAGQREGAAAGVGEPVRARLATEHGR